MAVYTIDKLWARSASSGHVNDGHMSTQSARLAREIRIVGWMGWASGTGALLIYRPASWDDDAGRMKSGEGPNSWAGIFRLSD